MFIRARGLRESSGERAGTLRRTGLAQLRRADPVENDESYDPAAHLLVARHRAHGGFLLSRVDASGFDREPLDETQSPIAIRHRIAEREHSPQPKRHGL